MPRHPPIAWAATGWTARQRARRLSTGGSLHERYTTATRPLHEQVTDRPPPAGFAADTRYSRRKEQTMQSGGFAKLIVAVAALSTSYAMPAVMPVNDQLGR
jgi:hypothetical protein